jgi:hypothetical protein
LWLKKQREKNRYNIVGNPGIMGEKRKGKGRVATEDDKKGG